MTDTTYYKGQVGKEDINFGDGVFNRRNKLKAWQQYTRVNDSQIPIKDNSTKFLHDIFDGGWDVDVYPRVMIPKTSADAAMTGHETFEAIDGHTFWRDPGGANRNFNPSGTFLRGHRIVLINTANDSEAITFDSTTLAQAVNQNERAIFEYGGSAWFLVNLYKPSTTTDIEFSPVFSADHSYNGLVIAGTAGEDLVFGKATYLKSDGKRWKTRANSDATMPGTAIAVGAMSADGTGTFLKEGYIRDDSWNWTVGGIIYINAGATTGGFTQTAPTGADDQVQATGYAYSSDIMYYDPNFIANASLKFSHDFADDLSCNGITMTQTAGENLAFGDSVYMKADGKFWKTDADAAATMPCVALAAATILADAAGTFLKIGYIRKDAWNWTVGAGIYVSTTTGELTETAPSANSDEIQVVGHAHAADIMYFNPTEEALPSAIMDVDTRVFIVGDAIKMEAATVEVFNMSSAGELVLAKQPAVGINQGSAQNNFAKDTPVTVELDTETFDQNGDYNTGTYTFTAPVTGKYRVNLALRLLNLDSASTYYYLSIVTSNGTYIIDTIDVSKMSGDLARWEMGGSLLVDMDAADTVYITINQSDGTAQTDISNIGSYMSVSLEC